MEPMIPLDEELDRALRVDPSPDFAARVRMRVAAEPGARSWRLPRLIFAAAAVAAMAWAAVTLPQRIERDARSPELVIATRSEAAWTPLRAEVRASQPASSSELPPVFSDDRQGAARERARAHAAITPAPRDHREVIVAASEMAALQRLFGGAHVLAQPAEPPAEALVIPEITIEPIALPTSLQGEGQ